MLPKLPAHQQVFAAFAIYAFGLGSIYPRMPDIQAAIGADKSVLGLALLGISAGTIAALTFAGPLLAAMGHRLALLIFTPLVAVTFAIAAHATGPLWLFILFVPAGLAIGAVEIIINLEADRVEAQIDRRIMSRSHAFWSMGFGLAGLFGGQMANWGVSTQHHMMIVVVVVVFAMALCLSQFQPAPSRGTDPADKPPAVAIPTKAIMILVGISFSAMVLEGAYMDWGAIFMRQVFEATPFVGGLAVAAGAFSQAALRYFGDSVIDRYSPVKVARGLLICMAVGVCLIAGSPNQIIALIGFALLGAGTSALFPLTISAAAQRTDRPSAINVAALAQFSFVAFLLGPPLLGFVAEAISLRVAFGVGLPLIAVSLWLSGALEGTPEQKD